MAVCRYHSPWAAWVGTDRVRVPWTSPFHLYPCIFVILWEQERDRLEHQKHMFEWTKAEVEALNEQQSHHITFLDVGVILPLALTLIKTWY